MRYGKLDYGGGPSIDPRTRTRNVADLTGPRGEPDVRFTLVAARHAIRLGSGRVVQALTFNGRSPGPVLRIRRGQLVQVTLHNKDVSEGVTIHWHGLDVENAEDGVAGVTQNAVPPGGSYTYRFRSKQVGTFWYHTHQGSSDGVARGLLGTLVVTEPGPAATRPVRDLVVVAHIFDDYPTLDGSDGVSHVAVRPGTHVRLRIVNTDSNPMRFTLTGASFRVAAIDGTDLQGPTPLRDVPLELAAGGRYDLTLTMPARPVGLALTDTPAAIALSPDGRADPPAPPAARGPVFDPLSYGAPSPSPFEGRPFDRRFTLTIGRKPGFYDGRPGFQWTLNGGIYPDIPMFAVEPGDLVEMRIHNTTKAVHPMHLHGHHMLVLSRDGVRSSGSPWWSDTLELDPGDDYVVAFRADNPGVWMDHCHNLGHAAAGLTMHLMYAGAATPFEVGGAAANEPE